METTLRAVFHRLQPPSFTIQPPSVTLQPPLVTLQPPSVPAALSQHRRDGAVFFLFFAVKDRPVQEAGVRQSASARVIALLLCSAFRVATPYSWATLATSPTTKVHARRCCCCCCSCRVIHFGPWDMMLHHEYVRGSKDQKAQPLQSVLATLWWAYWYTNANKSNERCTTHRSTGLQKPQVTARPTSPAIISFRG